MKVPEFRQFRPTTIRRYGAVSINVISWLYAIFDCYAFALFRDLLCWRKLLTFIMASKCSVTSSEDGASKKMKAVICM